MTLAHPLWLTGLLAVPLIWWLHRAAGHGRTLWVASLLPYRDAAQTASAHAPARLTDPAWRRRALAATALTLALAEPSLQQRSRMATAWIDDSLSMQTREAAGSRIAQGFAQLRALSEREHIESLEIRSLSNPAISYALDAPPTSAGADALHPPPRSALRTDREQWLVTDGTKPQLARWATAVPLQHVIVVGAETRNVALTAISARASLRAPAQVRVDVQVLNAAAVPAARTLTVWSAPQRQGQTVLRLAANETRRLSFDVPLAPANWRAQLTPPDALSADDRIVLPSAALRPARVGVDARCPRIVTLALRAAPMLQVVSADLSAREPTAASVVCHRSERSTAGPALLLRPDAAEPLQRVAALWSTAAREQLSTSLAAQQFSARGVVALGDADALLLLQSPAGALAVRHGRGPYQLVTTLDFSAVAPTQQASVAVQLLQLLELTLGRSLLAPVAQVSRAPQESQIARRAPLPAPTRLRDAFGVRTRDLAPWLLGLTALLLLWDLQATYRERLPT